MGLGRLNKGERTSGASALLLLVVMFFDWYGTKDSGALRLFSIGHNAWEALDYILIILVAAIVAALGVVALRVTATVHRPLVWPNCVVAILGIVSVLSILFRILDPPNFGSFQEVWGTVTIEGTVQLPSFLGLLAASGIASGACRSLQEEGVSLSDLRPGGHHS